MRQMIMVMMLLWCGAVGCVSVRMGEVETGGQGVVAVEVVGPPAWARTPANTIVREDDSVVVVHAQDSREFCVAQAQGVLFEDNMQRKRVVDVTNVVTHETRYLPPGGPYVAEEKCSWGQCISCKVVFLK